MSTCEADHLRMTLTIRCAAWRRVTPLPRRRANSRLQSIWKPLGLSAGAASMIWC